MRASRVARLAQEIARRKNGCGTYLGAAALRWPAMTHNWHVASLRAFRLGEIGANHKMLPVAFLGHRCRQSFQNPSKRSERSSVYRTVCVMAGAA